jgi:GTPase SAR1 family protein
MPSFPSFKQITAPQAKQAQNTFGLAEQTSNLYASKCRFAMLGTPESGKTTVAAGLVLTSQTRSSDLPDFKCRVTEGSTSIISDASKLRQGVFPAKTDAYKPNRLESGLLMKYKGLLGDKTVQVPICDASGEDVSGFIKKVKQNQVNLLDNTSYSNSEVLRNYIRDADGYILVIPASRVLIGKNQQIEKEAGLKLGLDIDPDVNLHRILADVIDYKVRHKGHPIKGLAIVITKWDLLAPFADELNMNILTPDGLKTFLDVCIPATAQEIKACDLKNVAVFPSWFDIERTKDGDPLLDETGHTSIVVDDKTRRPKYSEDSYMRLFDWLKAFAV